MSSSYPTATITPFILRLLNMATRFNFNFNFNININIDIDIDIDIDVLLIFSNHRDNT